MSTTTQSTPPYADVPGEETFTKAAKGYDAAYNHTQSLYQDLQTEAANMDSFYGLVQFFGTLQALCGWMSATQMMTEECASAVGGILQDAESIFTSGINEINAISQDIWEDSGLGGCDTGVPVPTVSELNSTYATQVANAQQLIDDLSDIMWDVSGAAFTATNAQGETVNPLSGIDPTITNDCEDFMYQVVTTYNTMATATLSGYATTSGDALSIYNPATNGGNPPPETYEEYVSSLPAGTTPPDYVNDPTAYMIDNGNSQMTGASGADAVCYAMLDWFSIYDTPVTYDYSDSTTTVNAPGMTENQSGYMALSDFQGINAATMGVSQQIIPMIALLSNLEKNALSAMYTIMKSMASIETQAVRSMAS